MLGGRVGGVGGYDVGGFGGADADDGALGRGFGWGRVAGLGGVPGGLGVVGERVWDAGLEHVEGPRQVHGHDAVPEWGGDVGDGFKVVGDAGGVDEDDYFAEGVGDAGDGGFDGIFGGGVAFNVVSAGSRWAGLGHRRGRDWRLWHLRQGT